MISGSSSNPAGPFPQFVGCYSAWPSGAKYIVKGFYFEQDPALAFWSDSNYHHAAFNGKD